MIDALRAALGGITVDEPTDAAPLRLFGLRWNAPQADYLMLDDAMATESLRVTEVSESGAVPQLRVDNSGPMPVLIVAGEQLIGGRQNRVVNASLMAAPATAGNVPVSCVEQGRWGYRSTQMRAAESGSHARLRRLMAQECLSGYLSMGEASSDQHRVWDEITRKLAASNIRSGTQALHDVFEHNETSLADLTDRAHVAPECSGVVFVCAGRIEGLELFDQPATLLRMWPKLVKSYGADALEPVLPPMGAVGREQVEAWIARVHDASFHEFASSGMGVDVRVESPEIIGAALVVEGAPVHVELFPNESQPERCQPRPAGRIAEQLRSSMPDQSAACHQEMRIPAPDPSFIHHVTKALCHWWKSVAS